MLPRECLNFVALGDSIAFGVGAADNYGYVNYFRDYLAARNQFVTLKNKAISGLTSSDLLTELRQETNTRDAVKNADIITISIGGANLLHCLNSDTPGICLSNEANSFSKDWPQILKELRKNIRSQADIYVITVYNPFTGNDPEYKDVEVFIQQINRTIKNSKYSSAYHYHIAEVHEDFQGRFTDGRWKVCSWTHFCSFPPNPHPSNSGHKEIARLHEIIYKRQKRFPQK